MSPFATVSKCWCYQSWSTNLESKLPQNSRSLSHCESMCALLKQLTGWSGPEWGPALLPETPPLCQNVLIRSSLFQRNKKNNFMWGRICTTLICGPQPHTHAFTHLANRNVKKACLSDCGSRKLKKLSDEARGLKFASPARWMHRQGGSFEMLYHHYSRVALDTRCIGGGAVESWASMWASLCWNNVFIE